MLPRPVASKTYEEVAGDGLAVVGRISSSRSRTPGETMSVTPSVTPPFPLKVTLPPTAVVPRLPVGEVRKNANFPASEDNEAEAVPEEIGTVALADFEGSETEVAVMVTDPPEGTVAGAVYSVGTLLAVTAGLNVPQIFAGPHIQLTLALLASPKTVAVSVAESPTRITPGEPLTETSMDAAIGEGGGGATGGAGVVGLARPPQPKVAKAAMTVTTNQQA
jgi:hypothetical protein